jgi:hypothetical protein
MKKLLTILFALTAFVSNAQNTLDNVGLTSATPASVAYSLRQLSTSYTGPLVRIKVGVSFYDVYPDASTKKFSLSSKISSSISTYNAAVSAASGDALSTIISGSTDATVAIWYDQSGNGVHVLSSSATAKIIIAGSILTMSGQPTINFHNSTSYLTSSSNVNYSSQSWATVNAVAQNVASVNGASGIISVGGLGDAAGFSWGLNFDPSTWLSGYWVDGSGTNGAASGVNSTDPKVVTALIQKNTSSSIYVNSSLKDTKASTTDAHRFSSSDVVFVGARGTYAGRYFIGNIAETIIFPKSLSSSEQAALESSQSIFLPPPPGVTITSSASGAVCAGISVTFTATVTGISSPTYQWTKNGIGIPGANSSTYSSTALSNNDQIKVWVNAGINNSAIVSNGLLLNLDASNPGSYSGTGNNWYDLSGNNNHATLMNSPTFDAASGSVVTNGTNQYLSVPLFNNSITNVTMQTWVYINTNTKGVFIANGYGNGYNIGIGDNGGFDNAGSSASMLFSGKRWMSNTGITYTSGWHLITMILDGSSTPSFYIDKTLKYSSTGLAPIIPTGYLSIGAIPGDNGRYYNGKFAAAYFYNRALSLSEIEQNYDAFATKSTGYGSNTITVAVTGSTPALTVTGDGCASKTTLSTTSGLTSYAWYKNNIAISGATSNTYSPASEGSYQVHVSDGSCSSTSTTTTIYTCGNNAYGQMVTLTNSSSLISTEGGANFGTGKDISGKIFNTTNIASTSGTIGSATAVLGGVISSTTGLTSSVGIIYSTDVNFGTYSTTTIQSNIAAGTYTSTISGLSSSTNYFAKSFIVNKAGTTYGSVVNFTTSALFQAPDLVTSGLITYLDASDASSYAGSGNTWTDKQGFANGTLNGSINYVSNGSASYFSLPGADDAYIRTSVNQSIKDFTIVFQPDFSSFNYSGGHTLFSKGPGVDVSMRFWSQNFADPNNTNGNTNSVWGVPNSSPNSNEWQGVHLLYLNGSNQTVDFFPLVNGWNILGGQNSTSNDWGSFAYCLGAGYNSRAFQGKIAVVLFYDRVLTAAEQLQNYNALKSRFGL